MSSSTPATNTLSTSHVPKSARIPEMPDLERLQKMKSSGKILSSIDEQRLRNHQLYKLRKLWIRDQRLSAREPLHPPLTWYEKLKCREEAFWNRQLKYRYVSDMLQGTTGSFKQFPMLMVYKFQGAVRSYFGKILVPAIPLLALFYMYIEKRPSDFQGQSPYPVFPKDDYFTADRNEALFKPSTMTFHPPGSNTQDKINE